MRSWSRRLRVWSKPCAGASAESIWGGRVRLDALVLIRDSTHPPLDNLCRSQPPLEPNPAMNCPQEQHSSKHGNTTPSCAGKAHTGNPSHRPVRSRWTKSWAFNAPAHSRVPGEPACYKAVTSHFHPPRSVRSVRSVIARYGTRNIDAARGVRPLKSSTAFGNRGVTATAGSERFLRRCV